MKTLTAWEAYVGSVSKWLADLVKAGEIDEHDTVWEGPDGGYAVGIPGIDDEEDPALLEYTDAGEVAEYI